MLLPLAGAGLCGMSLPERFVRWRPSRAGGSGLLAQTAGRALQVSVSLMQCQ